MKDYLGPLRAKLLQLAETAAKAGELQVLERDPEPAGLAQTMGERARAAGVAVLANSQMERVYSAILRIERGTYGFCATCGEEIPDARLSALPEAERCIECEEDLERVHARVGRVTPITEGRR